MNRKTLIVSIAASLCLLAMIAALLTWQVVAHEVRAYKQDRVRKKATKEIDQIIQKNNDEVRRLEREQQKQLEDENHKADETSR